MKSKKYIIICIVISMFFLVGWGKKSVELLNSTLLIDLDKAIEVAKAGGNTSDNQDENADQTDQDEADFDSGNESDEDAEPVVISVIIRVRDEDVYYSNLKIQKEDLLERIKRENTNYAEFVLEDDFAEAHVYKEVRKLLLDNKIDFSER